MRRSVVAILLIQVALVAGLRAAVRDPRVPLGVPREWEWTRIRVEGPNPHDLAFAVLIVAAYAAFVAAGMRALGRRAGPLREAIGVTALVGAAIVVQWAAMGGAPEAFGPEKVAMVLSRPGASGYYTEARKIRDVGRFWSDYPAWIKRQDELHIGTHPPGLILATDAALRAMRERPGWSRWVADHLPARVVWGFREAEAQFGRLPWTDRSALAVVAGLTFLAGAATVAPLYAVARSELTPAGAWAAAALWPLASSAVMFWPASDTAFPFLSATVLALSARGRPWSAVTAGGLLAVGMTFTLAFLPVGLAVAMVLATRPGAGVIERLRGVAATGLGFLAATFATWAASGADPFAIWRSNLANHARFYVSSPRSYGPWVVANPLDLAVGLGLPAACWAAAGLSSRGAPRVARSAFAVLILLDLGGRNLGEVARLWLLLMPLLLPAAGAGMARLGAGPFSLAATAALMGLQVLILQANIQVAYPP